jgi:hypothetical protein
MNVSVAAAILTEAKKTKRILKLNQKNKTKMKINYLLS